MTVDELIDRLATFPGRTRVVVTDDKGTVYGISSVYAMGSVVKIAGRTSCRCGGSAP